MTLFELKKKLIASISEDKNHDGVCHIDFGKGWNSSISQLANDYFSNNIFSFQLQPQQSFTGLLSEINKSTGNKILIESVKGLKPPFKDILLNINFITENNGAELKINSLSAKSIAAYLPLFQESFIDSIPFDTVTVDLDSSRAKSAEISYLQMNAIIFSGNPVIQSLKLLLGISDLLELSGPVWLENGGSDFYGIRLFQDVSHTFKTDHFSVTILDVGIIDECLYVIVSNSNFSYPFLSLETVFSFNDVKIGAHIDINNFQNDFIIKIYPQELFKNGVEKLAEILEVDKALPGSFAKGLSNVAFKELTITISQGLKPKRVTGRLEFGEKEEVFPLFAGLSLKNLGLRFDKFFNDESSISGQLTGTLALGTGVIEMQVSKEPAGYSASGLLMRETTLNLSDILKEFTTQNTVKIPDAAIDQLELSISKSNEIITWSFELALKGTLPIPFENPVFSISRIDFFINHTSNETHYGMEGILSVGAVDIHLLAEYNEGWIFQGSTGPNQLISIGELIDDLWDSLIPDNSVHKLPDSVAHLAAENVDVTLDLQNGFSFEIMLEVTDSKIVDENNEFVDSDAKWKPAGLPEDSFEFKDVKLSISRQKTISFTAEAVLELGGFSFGIDAEYNDGWSFSAGYDKVEGDQGITIESLSQAFDFTNPSLPEFISKISIEKIALSFQSVILPDGTKPAKSDKYFQISFSDQIGSAIVEIDLKLDITYPDSKENIAFSGHLTATDESAAIDPATNQKPKYVFDIIKQKSGEAKLLLASYHQENAKDVSLKVITDALGIKDGPAISIGLKDAIFANHSKSENEEAFNLFLADVGAGMNLSGLPLIGKVLPPEATVSIALRILYASAAYAWGLEDINGVLPAGISKISKPEELTSKGLGLISEIRIGGQTINLKLDIQPDDVQPNTKAVSGTGNSTDPASGNSAPAPVVVSSGNQTSVSDIKWIRIGKQFGPVVFNRIGVLYTNGIISVYPDVVLSLGGLTFSLDGLSVSSPINAFKPTFQLKGLGLDMNTGGVEIGASFLRRQVILDGETVDEFDGIALIKTANLSISALGSYAYYKGNPSLFVYAYLNQALGGPSFFFVEGLAVAFGFNRKLLFPTIDEVSSFPLVRQVMETSQPNPNLPRADLLTQQLDAISRYIPLSPGDMFLAVGIKFNSFKLIDSFVLLAVSFGNHLEIDVLGQSNILVPSERPPGVPPLAQIKIQLTAKYLPDEGFLAVRAQLTQDSYIFTPDCHLAGGAAFYSWFKGEHAGDFVVTMGGYHPAFAVPAHYPQVPRITFNWQIDPSMSIKGDMYFALCPHAFMAGGHLEALYSSGHLQAWFRAGADFLISWQPYHYDARLYLDIGASYTYWLFGTHTLTLDIGADVHLWGPELAGQAILHLWIIDIPVSFGVPGNTAPQPLSFGEFQAKCLPELSKIVSAAIALGQHNENVSKIPVVNASDLTIAINSALPSSSITIDKSNFSVPANGDKEIMRLVDDPDTAQFNGEGNFSYGDIGIAPMNVPSGIKSTMNITIKKSNDSLKVNSATNSVPVDHKDLHFRFMPVKKKVPAALWGSRFSPGINSQNKTVELVTGVTITTKEPVKTGETPFVSIDQLLTPDPINLGALFSTAGSAKSAAILDQTDLTNLCKLLELDTIPAYSYETN